MTSLVACLSTGKGTWSEVIKILNGEDWDKIYLITNDFGKEKFSIDKEVDLIPLNLNASPKVLTGQMVEVLAKKKLGREVAVNISSGSGNEHMALLSALLKLGLGMRFVYVEDGKVEELKLFDYSFEPM